MPLQEDVAFLEHHGVKGQKWGVTRALKKTDKSARKDAEESARAKMFYGKGAGTRRKLINESVKAKSARDPKYKKVFESHLAKQDLSTHASKARTERSRTDRKDRNKQRATYTARRFTGQQGTQAALAALSIAGIAYLNSPRARSVMNQAASTVVSTVSGSRLNPSSRNRAQQAGADFLADYFNRNG